MAYSTQTPPPSATHQAGSQGFCAPGTEALQAESTQALAQALLERLTITEKDWHRLKADRTARASEQVAAALLFLINRQPQEALTRLHQATGWLDRSISAPPCPDHPSRDA